jgi:hypothetical protein
VIRLVPLLVVLGAVGCAARHPSTLYPTPPPPIDPPALSELPTVEGCPVTEAMNAGDPAPYVDAVGVAECTALLVPPSTYQLLLRDASELLPYYRERLAVERDGRVADRDRADWYVDQLASQEQDLLREVRVLRFGVVGVAVVSVVAGIALGLAASDLAEVAP